MKQYLLITFFVYLSVAQADPTWNNAGERAKKELLDNGQLYINSVKPDFACGGIAMFDSGAAIDMPIYFADANSKKLICISGMGVSVSAGNGKCPPSEWDKNACGIKLQELYRKEREVINTK